MKQSIYTASGDTINLHEVGQGEVELEIEGEEEARAITLTREEAAKLIAKLALQLASTS